DYGMLYSRRQREKFLHGLGRQLRRCRCHYGPLLEVPEKPNSALDFLKHHLGAATPENPEIELLLLELAEMKEKYEAIVEENKKLKTKLAQYEPPQEEKRAE
uniref:c-Myc-binding protein n=1 Tax=Equus asinus asinus TaxID=83772 RepID=A0A8C4M0F9_EQUAS